MKLELIYTNNVNVKKKNLDVFGEFTQDKDELRWDTRLMDLALHVSQWSKDPRTGVGSVIAKGKREIDLGYNGFPEGIRDFKGRLEDYDLKHQLMIHAEKNAMDNSTRDLRGRTLYVTYPPCVPCTVSIISRKIGRVVTLESTPEKMEKHKVRIEQSKDLFIEARIRFDIFRLLDK